MKKPEKKIYKVDFETEEQAKAFKKLLKVLKIKVVKDPNATPKAKATKKTVNSKAPTKKTIPKK